MRTRPIELANPSTRLGSTLPKGRVSARLRKTIIQTAKPSPYRVIFLTMNATTTAQAAPAPIQITAFVI